MNRFSKYAFAAIGAALILSHCGSKEEGPVGGGPVQPATSGNLGGSAFRIVGTPVKHEIKTDSVSAESASLVFAKAAPEVLSSAGYEFTFTVKDGGSFTLVSHATEKLENGVTLKFTRKGNFLKLSAASPGKWIDPKEFEDAKIDATGTIALAADVQNKKDPSLAIIWLASVPRPDRDDHGNEIIELKKVLGRGAGKSFGVILKDATVSKAEIFKNFHHEH